MQDPNLALLKAFKTALTGLTVSGQSIPVYPAIAPLKNVPDKYILLGSQSRIDNKTKCGYWWDAQITADIVTRYPNGTGDVLFAMEIGESVSALVQDVVLTLSGFNIRERMQAPPEQLPLQTSTQDIYRYLITFTYKINRA